jgi:3',5'-cyclic-AMP phosphodiesterase
MKIKRIFNATIIVLLLCLVAGVGSFIYNAKTGYIINSRFVPIPLQFNPDDSSSAYQMQNSQITVYGGFIKGMQKNQDGTESLVIRALSPLPAVTVSGNSADNLSLLIENINPDLYAKNAGVDFQMAKVKVNTIQLSITVAAGQTIKIEPMQPADADNTGQY